MTGRNFVSSQCLTLGCARATTIMLIMRTISTPRALITTTIMSTTLKRFVPRSTIKPKMALFPVFAVYTMANRYDVGGGIPILSRISVVFWFFVEVLLLYDNFSRFFTTTIPAKNTVRPHFNEKFFKVQKIFLGRAFFGENYIDTLRSYSCEYSVGMTQRNTPQVSFRLREFTTERSESTFNHPLVSYRIRPKGRIAVTH